MYKVFIKGTGSEITQGCLPIDVVKNIKSGLNSNSELASYFLDTLDSDDKLNWFDINDNFHFYGANVNDSILIVETEQNEIVYQEPCGKLKCKINYTSEIYPEDFKLEPIAVLTCIEQFDGYFLQGLLNEDILNPLNFCIHIESLGDHSLVSHITYNDTVIAESLYGLARSKDFLVFLEE